MSCEQEKCKSSNLENNLGDYSLILKEIANDEELKSLTEEDIKAIFGGEGVNKPEPQPPYGSVLPLQPSSYL
ncbi:MULTISPECIES: hypothetical protein [Microcystis]|uniref:Uncharacterized protein n=1 Tax=Microcystis panniformis FACHB-1757 TaxID=1638788 RepID=A0A0K1S8U1_9CHRO|nr:MULTISPECIES: hypothetical protein [Microcystis]AKV70448.1 hypothetical protein VL20_5628 [Microcystis panniformis FACHB-1757]TRT76600.1 MAG: hypothetical protein EWV83_10500 [Microcystis sp. M_OC_Ca_00000000_S217Cul]TRT90611.1 MAG: hypothetical protein EWV66_08050 [Microcystis sp. M_OC_Ca_00000000_C217Col]